MRVICCLRRSADYNDKYVKALQKSVSAHLQADYDFICLTDEKVEDVKCVSLIQNWQGWWSKIELFRFAGPTIFFDLDTVIVENLQPIYDLVYNHRNEKHIWMLKPFSVWEKMASGIMAWTGDWNELYVQFDYEKHKLQFRGDQDYLYSLLKTKENTGFIQDTVSGIYSYKYHCKKNLPNDSRIVCFHGKPRPHEVQDVPWVSKNWSV